MRADNDGEGGIMALIALIREQGLKRRSSQVVLVALGIFGASLFYGDGMITPAISVLSAVEGLEVAAPSMASMVVPITLAILTVLFAIQRFGTRAVGRLFGPVMTVWFTVLAVSGLAEVVRHPGILRAVSPTYALEFMVNHGGVAFAALGSVVLAVTGAEALYADMGHFGRSAIRRAWFALVFPALILNYMGQGALILRAPESVERPFFLLFPDWSRIPMVLLATAATVIASQAVISGAFSVTRQAVQLGFLPRLTILHTSGREIGQVYVPAVNWVIFVAVVALVVGFGTAEHLASAYGVAVTGTLAIDTILFFFVVRAVWKRPLWVVVAGTAFFLTVDLAFFAANVPKVLHGGWFPLVVAAVIFVVLTTWHRGREIVTRRRTAEEGPLRDFVEEVRGRDPAVYRVPRTGVFLNANRETTPLALRANVEHNNAMPQHVVIFSVETLGVPHVPVRLPGQHRRAAHAAGRGRPARARRRLRAGVLLPLADHDRAGRRRRHGHVAQAAVRRDRAQRGEPGAVLQPARRAHGRRRRAHRAVSAPPAPWRSEVAALLWWHRATPAGRDLLPPALARRGGLPVTIGGLISYRHGPVGPYREVLGAPVLLRRGPGRAHVAFMAVDSAASVPGGRGNWALPKELARFEGDPGAPGIVTARGEGWALAVTARARGRPLPAWGRLTCAQVWPDGAVRAFAVTVRGRARLGRVEVEHEAGSPLATWLRAGRHPAVLVDGVQVVTPARDG